MKTEHHLSDLDELIAGLKNTGNDTDSTNNGGA